MVKDTCAASCMLSGLPGGYRAGWAPVDVSTTLTHATIIEIINTDLDTTRTSTIYDDEVPLPTDINKDGFRTQKVSYTRDGKAMTTNIVFPTIFYVIPQQWVWSGILSTLDDDGESTCVTTSGATFSHDYYSQPTTFTVPSRYDGLDDPQGWLYKPQHLAMDLPDEDATDQDALISCGATANAPVEPAYAAAYVTATKTSYESGSATPTATGSDEDDEDDDDNEDDEDNKESSSVLPTATFKPTTSSAKLETGDESTAFSSSTTSSMTTRTNKASRRTASKLPLLLVGLEALRWLL